MTNYRLIILTRYPEPGKAKTRLIPALGATGAADLHRQMVEHTLEQVRSLLTLSSASISTSVEVRFVGGDATKMQDWLGQGISYQEQGVGNLGDRLIQAFQRAFQEDEDAVIVIGTDCPGIDTLLLQKAFQELQDADIVLGPATDGGYYLIGLRRFLPVPLTKLLTKLFTNIAWSTSVVLQQTVAIAEQLGLAIAYLPVLSDIDYPEDLVIWERAQRNWAQWNQVERPSAQTNQDAATIAVIIPVLNEAKRLAATLTTIVQTPSVKVIVVDGGSQDDTVAIAETYGVKVISSSPGRANQMNAGAAAATAEVLLFLHADTCLPTQFDVLVHQTLAQAGTVAGAFELQIDASLQGVRWIERLVNWRSRVLQMPYGDQAIFLKRSVFQEIGGFPALPIMEDFEMMRRLKALGIIAIAPAAVLTSGRRWERLGVLKTTLINQLVIAAYFLGISPDRIAHWYRSAGKNHKKISDNS